MVVLICVQMEFCIFFISVCKGDVDLMITFVLFLRKRGLIISYIKSFMKKIYWLLLLLWTVCTCPEKVQAQDFEQDSIEFSLLTCSPSTEIYALYGHTAIRYRNMTNGDDWAFNYGLFDFGAPNFIWRFTKGECDYELGIIPYDLMEEEYRRRGSAVYAQVLNLTREEKENLFRLLMMTAIHFLAFPRMLSQVNRR